jgi:membrane-associated phospholipid phosphatase
MNSPNKINLTAFTLFLFGLIIVFVSGINKSLFIGINTFTAGQSPFIWTNLTFLGDSLPAACVMILIIRKRPDLVWAALIATLMATIIVNLFKFYTGVLRPPAVIDKDIINIIGPVLLRRSFPSGHTVTIFTLAGILIFYFRSVFVRLGLILFALLVGISRIAVGVHWPADILAGAAVGILCATIGVYVVTRLEWNKNRTMQIITGSVLIALCLYLLFFYNSKYNQAIYLQYILGFSILALGMREYYYLLKNQ